MKFIIGTVLGIVKSDRILLMKRNKHPYVGFWGLPGGKVKAGEHIHESALREAAEETGLRTDFHSFRGVVSEHLIENGEILNHFILLVCRMSPGEGEIKASKEGELKWFKFSEIKGMREKIIPSDMHIINRMILGEENKNFKSVIEKDGDNYVLKTFKSVGTW